MIFRHFTNNYGETQNEIASHALSYIIENTHKCLGERLKMQKKCFYTI